MSAAAAATTGVNEIEAAILGLEIDGFCVLEGVIPGKQLLVNFRDQTHHLCSRAMQPT